MTTASDPGDDSPVTGIADMPEPDEGYDLVPAHLLDMHGGEGVLRFDGTQPFLPVVYLPVRRRVAQGNYSDGEGNWWARSDAVH